jgi:hypothetical protein
MLLYFHHFNQNRSGYANEVTKIAVVLYRPVVSCIKGSAVTQK